MGALYDTFTGSSGTLAAHTSDSGHSWSDVTTVDNYFELTLDGSGGAIITNSDTSTAASAISSWVPGSADYTAGARITIRSADTREIAVGLRCASPSGQGELGYYGGYSSNQGGWLIYKGSLTGFDPLGAVVPYVPGSLPVSHDIVVKVSGSSTTTVLLYVDGSLVLTRTDSSTPITAAGSVGLRAYSPATDGTHGVAYDSVGTPPENAALTGPSSGTAGIASANFALTLESPKLFDGTVCTVTPSDSSGGGSFSTPATIAAGSTSTTFTYTAGSAGTKSVSATTALPTTTVSGSPIAYTAAAVATSFTLTGPSSGTVGSASSNFTFTPNATYSGTITPSMTGLAGTWTPTALTWTASSAAKTATFTPSASGAGNANGTGSPSLTQPSNVAFTATATAATAFALTGPSTGAVGVASDVFMFTPNGVYTGTITPSMTGLAGTWSPSTLTWTGDGSAKTSTFTASATGTGTANGTGSPSLTQPSNVSYAATTGRNYWSGVSNLATGLSLTYAVYDSTGTATGATGVGTERGAGSGNYAAVVTLSTGELYEVRWSDGANSYSDLIDTRGIQAADLPANFAALGISLGGKVSEVSLVDVLTTYTGNTPQTGDVFARVGAAGAGLTAIGDTRLANLDVAVSTRSTYAGGAVASVTNPVTVSGTVQATLVSTGLDAISIADPGGASSINTFPKYLVWLTRHFLKKTSLVKTGTGTGNLITYADDGTTIRTTRALTDDGTTQTQGAAT